MKGFGIWLLTFACLASVASASCAKQPAAKEENAVAASLEEDIMALIRDMYDRRLYDDIGYMSLRCTERFQRELADTYSAQSEGEGFAGWLFISGRKDAPERKHSIIGISRLADGWWRYEAYDQGTVISREVRVVEEDGMLFFDGIR